MLSIIECCLLSGHIYETIKKNFSILHVDPMNIDDFKKSDIKNAWIRMEDVDPSLTPALPCYAQLYIKVINGKPSDAVVAIRGTEFNRMDNIMVDAVTWYSDVLSAGKHNNNPSAFLSAAFSYTIKAYGYIRKHFPSIHQLKYTGHSLGGALAQLIVLTTGFQGSCVTFNSPGVGNLRGVNMKLQNLITNVNSRYCAISIIGNRVGKIYVIDVPEKLAEAKLLFESLDMKRLGDLNKLLEESHAQYNAQKDKKVFLSGLRNFYHLTSDISLAGLHFLNYNRAYRKLFEIPQIKNAAQACNKEELLMYLTPITYAIQKARNQSCSEKLLLSNFSEIIGAQHGIVNLTHALAKKENAHIANIFV